MPSRSYAYNMPQSIVETHWACNVNNNCYRTEMPGRSNSYFKAQSGAEIQLSSNLSNEHEVSGRSHGHVVPQSSTAHGTGIPWLASTDCKLSLERLCPPVVVSPSSQPPV